MQWNELPKWAQELIPIGSLLVLVAIIVTRLPKIDLGHAPAFIRRRRMNWIPLGLTYAFLYMGRYNLTVASDEWEKLGLVGKDQFGDIMALGAIVYGVSFLINGPLADRWGGRRTILIASFGSALMNLLMGLVLYNGVRENLVLILSVLFSANMYFQSFGAVSIVKVNASWFHVRERGVLGGVFGILISLGIYFAFDWNGALMETMGAGGEPASHWVFFVPAALLLLFFVISFGVVFDTPSKVGHSDFDVADASSGDDGPSLTAMQVFGKMLCNPIIMTIAAIEFCSGYLRMAIMQWGRKFLGQTGQSESFVYDNWGMLLCMAGITGGMFAGTISDHVFGSRRGPVAAVLYAGMLVGAAVMIFLVETPMLGWLVIAMSMCIIGVHGMLSGTASMDFGGKKNAGAAVGLIDGFVYLGVAAQSKLLGEILPKGDAAKDAANWNSWPYVMIPVALIGLLFAARIWNARPKAVKTDS